jgi:RND family efflux transporter MFP subunit
MGFRVPGEVLAREVEVGDRVVEGDVLARLDPTDLELARTAATAEVEAAREELARAEAEATRSRALLGDGHVPQAATEAAIAIAAEAQGRLDRAVAALALSVNQAEYAVLRADAPGVITSVSAEPGQIVAAGQAVVTLARTDALDAVIALPEQLLPSLENATATAVLWGEENVETRSLQLREVAPNVDPTGRTYAVRLAFQDPTGIPLGRTVTVTLLEPERGEAAPLPLAAVVDLGDGAALWRLRGAGVERVPVTVVRLTSEAAWVTGPLAPGDRVVALGAHKVDPARPVRAVETVQPPA